MNQITKKYVNIRNKYNYHDLTQIINICRFEPKFSVFMCVFMWDGVVKERENFADSAEFQEIEKSHP